MNNYDVILSCQGVQVTAKVEAAPNELEAYKSFMSGALRPELGCLACPGESGTVLLVPLQSLGPILIKETGPALAHPKGIITCGNPEGSIA
jgi:hypothetical protein